MSASDLIILLSSYNGDRFIADQISSIQRQTSSTWTLLVRDDGSADETIAIVESLAARDTRISLLRDTRGNLGPAASFGILLATARESKARYVALADQDDVWLPTKLARELELLQTHEAISGATTPLLVHSDLAVVREDLTLVHRSFLEYQGLRHEHERPLGSLLFQNFVTGSTVIINRALLDVVVPVPKVIMHDWWLALCAAAFGRILYLPEATVRYRQHENNAQGSRGRWAGLMQGIRSPGHWWGNSAAMLDRAVDQARELAERVERLSPDGSPTLAMLREFCSAFSPDGSALKRLRAVYRHRIRPRSLLPYPVPFYTRVLLWGELQGREAAPSSRSKPDTHRNARARP